MAYAAARRPSTRRTPRTPRTTPYEAQGAPSEDEQARDDAGDPQAVARIVCLRLLDQRARSRGELEQALAKREIPADAVKVVLDRFTEVGLIDDLSLAQSVAGAQHRERGLARRAVAHKLRQRGFDDEAVDAAVAGIDSEQERSRAEALVTKKLRSLRNVPADVQTRRLVGLLARKGYPSGVAYEVVRAAVAGAGELASDDAVDGLESS